RRSTASSSSMASRRRRTPSPSSSSRTATARAAPRPARAYNSDRLPMSTGDPERTPDAATRILHASARLFADGGAARFNLQEVAEAAGVSKGLIHYHYHDRDTLLARLIEMLSAAVVARQQRAMAEATPATAID